MYSLVNQSVGNSYSCENFNDIKQDPIGILHDELILEIFSHLNLTTLRTICCVSKAWKRLANETILWKIAIYREMAFGDDKWAQSFETDVVKDEDNREEFSSLPSDDFICENFNKTKQDPIEILPDELVLEVFSHLNLATLRSSCCVSKAWKRLANEPILWKIAIYREIAFGNDKWAQCFGTDVVKDEDNREEFSSLPSDDFIADCKKFKNIFPEKNAKDSLMLVRLPKTLNGGLTLKSLGELAKKYFSDSDSGYNFLCPAIVKKQGDKSIDKSHWVLMTKDFLPGSMNKSYVEQQKIVLKLAEKSLIGYEIPETLESVACILSQYFGSNIRLFSNNPWTSIRCKEKVKGHQIIVGDFEPAGLDVMHDDGYNRNIGVAALRKF